MDTCEHCHNVLARSVDRCTVCGTLRADPLAGDVRRRNDTDAPSHAPGWAAPAVKDGLHPDEFLRELTGEAPDEPTPPPALPPRTDLSAPTGALAGYLGTTIERKDEQPPPAGVDAPPPPSGEPLAAPQPPEDAQHGQLTTATKLTPDGVAARSTRLDGSVKLGPVPHHNLFAFGAPLLAAILVAGAILMSYQVRTSVAAGEDVTQQLDGIDATAISRSSSAVVRLDLDGCGVVSQATGFLFADQAILEPRSDVVTDDRPTVIRRDGSVHGAEIVGWSITRDVAVVRADDRLPGGLRWGVSGRSEVGDVVSVLTVTGPGAAEPVPAQITDVDKIDGVVSAFELDLTPEAGSAVLNSDGFVIGLVGTNGSIQVSDDLSPAVSRIVLANERPQADCPRVTTTTTDDADE